LPKTARLTQGNQAMAEGAFYAGARFYAGYPITPSSEVADIASRQLPKLGGIYMQMEDEIASIAAVIGASLSGKKSFTATSGPGFSLMQENLGVAIMGEVPCVVIDVQRSGPSTGLATKPGQSDFMQIRWGRHGDQTLIALAPASVRGVFYAHGAGVQFIGEVPHPRGVWPPTKSSDTCAKTSSFPNPVSCRSSTV
jgi:2-oxoglutarate ferredoxin oxidoreductase subunit alpha